MNNFIIFSIIYILVFSGYYVTTGFLNIMYPNYGFWSFVIFYSTYAISNLFAPYMISKFPFRVIFCISTFTFLIFIGFSSSYMPVLLLIGSAISGFGNGFIWLIQGIYLSSFENNSSEYQHMGLFYSLFNINMIFGNLIGLIVLLTGASIQIMIFTMIGISSIGVFLTIFVSDDNIQNQNSNSEIKEINFISDIKNVFLISVYNKYYLLIPCMIYSSIGLNITYQIIPRLLISNTEGDLQIKAIYNAAIYIAYGLSAMGFSILWGKLFVSSEKGWKYVIYSYSILEILCLVGILTLAKFNTQQGYWIIIGVVRGCIDYGINNLINITLSNFASSEMTCKESDKTKYLFALYRLIYSVSYLLGAISVGYLSYEYVLLIDGSICILSTISYTFYQLSNTKKNNLTIEKQFDKTCIDV